jgi:hypothetical protein
LRVQSRSRHGISSPSGTEPVSHRRRRISRARRLATIGGAALIGSAVLATAASADVVCASGRRASGPPCIQYQFQTINDNADPTFNQLLGINKSGQIAGYFGSGVPVGNAGHPNQGYLLNPSGGQYPQSGFTLMNYPKSAQTQDVGINNAGTLVGFWSDMNNPMMGNNAPVNDSFGWYQMNGQFHNVVDPNTAGTPPMNQLLGVNNHNVAVGFYNDANNNNVGYFYDIASGMFQNIKVPSNVTSSVAAGVNDNRDIAGFATTSSGTTEGFLIHGGFKPIMFPGSTMTMATGVDSQDRVVGVYTTGSGSNTFQGGFTWKLESVNGSTNQIGVFQTISDPNGMGTTTVNGIDGCGNLVGFYVDGNGNTNGMLAQAPSGGSAAAADVPTAHADKKKKHKKHKKIKGC